MIALLSFALLAATPSDSTEAAHALVKKAVYSYVAPHDPTPEASLWRVDWADVNSDSLVDALAFAADPDWCGSGGCTLLIIEAIPEVDHEELGAYAVAGEIGMVSGPIVMSAAQHYGWHDLVVHDEEGTRRRLSFDGETYPVSPAGGEPCGPDSGTLLFDAAE